MQSTVSAGKYRLRTSVRGSLPYRLLWLSPKGRGDCGHHEWYRSEGETWRCYHCEAGISDKNPLSPAERLEVSVGALRLAAQLPSTPETQATIARLVGELDQSVHPMAEQLESDPASIARIQAALQA